MFDLTSLRGTLIASCQAPAGSPLRDPELIAVIAEAAVLGGAAGIRANGADHVAAIKRRVDVPVLGLIKRLDADGTQWITPTVEDARSLAEAGADVIALDATLRPRPLGPDPDVLIGAVRGQLGLPVLADVDDLRAARHAQDAGADLVATTLAGYTGPEAPGGGDGPDIALVRHLTEALTCPVIAEGRYRRPEQVAAAFEAGAFAVVVGTAICDPVELTARFVAAVPDGRVERGPAGERHPDEPSPARTRRA